MLARDVEVDLGLFQFILDGDVLIVSLDGKLFPRCYSVRKHINVRPLKQVPTREFSFVKSIGQALFAFTSRVGLILLSTVDQFIWKVW